MRAGWGRSATRKRRRDRSLPTSTRKIRKYGLKTRWAVTTVAEQLARMLPTSKLLPARHGTKMRIPVPVQVPPAARLRQRATSLAAPMPPAILLPPTRLLTDKAIPFLHGFVTLNRPPGRPTPAFLLNLHQALGALTLMALLLALMNPARQHLITSTTTSRYWIQAALPLFLQLRLPTTTPPNLLRR